MLPVIQNCHYSKSLDENKGWDYIQFISPQTSRLTSLTVIPVFASNKTKQVVLSTHDSNEQCALVLYVHKILRDKELVKFTKLDTLRSIRFSHQYSSLPNNSSLDLIKCY